MSNLNEELKALEEAFEVFPYRINDVKFKLKPTFLYQREDRSKFFWPREMSYEEVYNVADAILTPMVGEKKITPRACLVERFFDDALEKYSSEKSDFNYEFRHYMGFFLSALSNLAIKDETPITLQVRELGKQMDGLGSFLKESRVRVEGHTKDFTGAGMNDGELIIKGDAGNYLGATMSGGRITVNGKVGDKFGQEMEGGEITINGDAGRLGAEKMKNGVITINGNVGDSLGYYMNNGTITINGNVGENLGFFMNDGTIFLPNKESLKAVSSSRYGGKIYYGKKLSRRKVLDTREFPRTIEEFAKNLNKSGSQ